MEPGETIPVERTDTSYDIVATLGELTTRTEDIDTAKLSEALTTMGDTLNAASPHIQSTFTGLCGSPRRSRVATSPSSSCGPRGTGHQAAGRACGDLVT